MKYWNKGKRYRESWYKVEGPPDFKARDVKLSCQLTGSSDRFFFQSGIWYFENSEDALSFAFIWATKISITK